MWSCSLEVLNVEKISFFPLKLFVQVLRGFPYITVSIETSFPISTYLHTKLINIKRFCHQTLFI